MASLGPHHGGHHQFLAAVEGEGQETHPNTSGISRHMWLNLALDSLAIFALGAHQVVVELEAEPEAG